MGLINVDALPRVVIFGAQGAEEVIQNVRTIITTRKGTVPLDREFGLDFSSLDDPTPAARAKIQSEIFIQIKKYEPRAVVKEISFDNDRLNALGGRVLPTIRIEVSS